MSWPTTRVSLLMRIKDNRDQDAWADFVAIYQPLIHRFCYVRLGKDSDADDATQEVLKVVAEQSKKFEYDPEKGRFRGWLGRVTRNVLIKQASVRKHVEISSELSSKDIDAHWIDEFNLHIYETAIDRIRNEFSEEKWSVFERVWVKQESPKQVADTIGKTPAWVSRVKYAVLQRLRSEVAFLTGDVAHLNR